MFNKYMKEAIRLADQHVGNTGENPSVGCVIVKDGEVIATGVTALGGRPHAETIALEQAGERAAGADIYLTLEPCSHYGKTPPCVDRLIAASVGRVIVACLDPNPLVNGSGIAKLRARGIEVREGVLREEASKLIEGFRMRVTHYRPLVTLKMASSLDGKIATKNYQSKWLTSLGSRDYGHYLRSRHDAILVGSNTVLHDDPMLDCRLPGKEHLSPIRIVLDRFLSISLASRLVQSARQIPLIIYSLKGSEEKGKELEEEGVRIIYLEELNPEGILKSLASLGINSVLVEGGGKIYSSFLAFCDYIVHITAPLIIGNDGIPLFESLQLSNLSEAKRLQLIEHFTEKNDIISIYKTRR